MGSESGYLFVSSTESLKGKPYVISREEYLTYNRSQSKTENKTLYRILSLQDLKGSIYFGGNYDKLKHVKDMHWDLLVIDEAHEGIDTSKPTLLLIGSHAITPCIYPALLLKPWLMTNFRRTQF